MTFPETKERSSQPPLLPSSPYFYPTSPFLFSLTLPLSFPHFRLVNPTPQTPLSHLTSFSLPLPLEIRLHAPTLPQLSPPHSIPLLCLLTPISPPNNSPFTPIATPYLCVPTLTSTPPFTFSLPCLFSSSAFAPYPFPPYPCTFISSPTHPLSLSLPPPPTIISLPQALTPTFISPYFSLTPTLISFPYFSLTPALISLPLYNYILQVCKEGNPCRVTVDSLNEADRQQNPLLFVLAIQLTL